MFMYNHYNKVVTSLILILIGIMFSDFHFIELIVRHWKLFFGNSPMFVQVYRIQI